MSPSADWALPVWSFPRGLVITYRRPLLKLKSDLLCNLCIIPTHINNVLGGGVGGKSRRFIEEHWNTFNTSTDNSSTESKDKEGKCKATPKAVPLWGTPHTITQRSWTASSAAITIPSNTNSRFGLCIRAYSYSLRHWVIYNCWTPEAPSWKWHRIPMNLRARENDLATG